MEHAVVLEVKHMDKSFGITVALNDVSLTVRRGEVLGLIGENGSGKSTVTSIISGIQKCDRGEMYYEGQPWTPQRMIDALEMGVGMIVQETGTVPGITVAENIFLGESKKFRTGPRINRKAMMKAADDALGRIGAGHIKGNMLTAELDLQDRKLVEIAKVMSKDPQILIVDETTTALSQTGRTIIYRMMDKMKKANKAVIFISHDLDEIMAVCNVLTVLRDGKIINTFSKEQFDENDIKTSMIGKELKGDYYRSDYDGSYQREVVLEMKDGQSGNQLVDFNLQLHKGEILGIGGLSHCGMHTLGKAMFGAVPLQSGEVKVHGEPVVNEANAMKHKVGYVAKDRDTESLCLEASIVDNISIAGLDKIAGKGLISPAKEKKYVQEQIDSLSIKCAYKEQDVSALSGGNKQKVVFGKWIGRDSEILILDCPTRGVDIGVKQAMYQLMYQMKKEGKSILLISEELSELIGMSDRLLIMKDGKAEQEFERNAALTEADLIGHMI